MTRETETSLQARIGALETQVELLRANARRLGDRNQLMETAFVALAAEFSNEQELPALFQRLSLRLVESAMPAPLRSEAEEALATQNLLNLLIDLMGACRRSPLP